MVVNDLTPQLRELVARYSSPGTKRRRNTRRKDEINDTQMILNNEYLQEAHNILNHIRNLSRMLSSIRGAYLDMNSNPGYSTRQSNRNIELDGSEGSWSSLRHLTNEERDQIDLQAKMIIAKCADRLRQMEELEKKRTELLSADNSLFTRLLPTRLRQDIPSIAEANRAAHHSSIICYVNRRLAEVGQAQKEMQEERVKRQMERTRTLGSSIAKEATGMGLGDIIPISDPVSFSNSKGTRSWIGDAASSIASSIGLPSQSTELAHSNFQISSVPNGDETDDDDYEDIELSTSQIHQFEAENANILRSVQDTLASVQQAEARLMDISALQMQLVAHLTKQTEVTEQLYEDAVNTTASVERGNIQLREAKRRAADGRLYILVFLISSSLALLFLHYY